MNWTTFYQGRVFSDDYLVYASKKYAPFIDEIRNIRKTGDRIVEVGCGIATITKILVQDGVFCGYRCYDINPDMVALAEANLRDTPKPVEVGDALLPLSCKPDIVHSHGLLEHFEDANVCNIIAAQADSGVRAAVHYVPGEKYERPSFGDERLLPLSHWVDRFKPTHAFDFNDGYDYCLVWRF